jgi:hypothetical protein
MKVKLNINQSAINAEVNNLKQVADKLKSIHEQLELQAEGAFTAIDVEEFKKYVSEKSGFAFSEASVALLQLEKVYALQQQGEALKSSVDMSLFSQRGYTYKLTKTAEKAIETKHTAYLPTKLVADYEVLSQIEQLASKLSDGRLMKAININEANGEVDLLVERLNMLGSVYNK